MSTKEQGQDAVVLADGEYQFSPRWAGMIKQDVTALIAASFPVKPPASWFADPKFRDLTPLSIDNTGRVSGHIAGWKTAHIGLAGGVRPPKSRSGYAFFRTGSLETAEGDFVDVGQITLAGGHAPLDVSVEKAVAHYDDTKSAVMDVTCGEDRHGIWVAGALRPSIDDATIRTIRASSVSGDWRPINGRLELVAVCAVNCPGFPIPRSLVSGGQPVALVAAGTEPIIEKILHDRAAEDLDEELKTVIEQMRNRIKRVENAVLFSDGTVPDGDEGDLDEEVDEDIEEIEQEIDGDLSEVDTATSPGVEERLAFLEDILTTQIATQRNELALAASIEEAKSALLADGEAPVADTPAAEAPSDEAPAEVVEGGSEAEVSAEAPVAEAPAEPEASAEPIQSDEEKEAALAARRERIEKFRVKVKMAREARDKAKIAQIAELRKKVNGTELSAQETLAASLRERVHQK